MFSFVNRGSSSAVTPAGLDFDISGLPRVQHGRPDLGAHEQQESCVVSTVHNPIAFNTLQIFPNPAPIGLFSFILSEEAPWASQVSVLDQNGMLIYRENLHLGAKNNIQIKGLASGVYHILVKQEPAIILAVW